MRHSADAPVRSDSMNRRAISETASAGHASATSLRAWRSPILALFWKEWRQQVWHFLLMTGASLVFVRVAIAWLSRYSPGTAVGTEFVSIFPLMVPWILAANTFSGEDSSRVSPFVEALPYPRGRIFWLKSAVVMLLSVPAVYLTLNWAIRWESGNTWASELLSTNRFAIGWMAYILAATCVTAAIASTRTIRRSPCYPTASTATT